MTRRAFTLIELMVVVIIVAVLATLMLPQFAGSLDATRLRGVAEQFYQTARYARRMAVLEQRPYRLILVQRDASTGRPGYRVEVATTDAAAEETFQPLRSGPVQPEQLPEDLRFGQVILAEDAPGGDQRIVAFSPDGSADAAVIQVTNGRRIYSILIEPNTGAVSLVPQAVRMLPNNREDLDV